MSDDPANPVRRAQLARRLVRCTEGGVLSTMSLDLPGYPFGSLTPFVTTHDGMATVFVSGIAQHTKNMQADPRVSLTVVEDAGRQDLGRVTIVGDAAEVPAERLDEVRDRYFRMFPSARGYEGTHDFAFWWIAPRRVRYIGGFGQIFWVEPADWSLPAPEWQPDEQGIIDHMNEDHTDAMARMLRRHAGIECAAPEMVACDVEGLHLRADSATVYLPFDAPCPTADEVRVAVVKLARAE